MTKFHKNRQRSSKEIEQRLSNFMIFWLFLIKTIAYKMKIRIFLNNPSMQTFHTSWYLTWCKIFKKKNEQFSGKIWKGAISYKKYLYNIFLITGFKIRKSKNDYEKLKSINEFRPNFDTMTSSQIEEKCKKLKNEEKM